MTGTIKPGSSWRWTAKRTPAHIAAGFPFPGPDRGVDKFSMEQIEEIPCITSHKKRPAKHVAPAQSTGA